LPGRSTPTILPPARPPPPKNSSVSSPSRAPPSRPVKPTLQSTVNLLPKDSNKEIQVNFLFN
jgi:hypothetical protein